MTRPTSFTVRRPQERLISGSAWGPTDGQPVLFVAGAGTGKTMAFGEELLAERGLRLITLDRSGMGASDHDPARTLASTVADYTAVCDAVTGRPGTAVPVVANSQGGVFGLGLAAQGAASRLVLVSPADEVAFPAVRAQLPDEAAALSDLARSDPDAAAQILGGFSAAAMEEMVLAGAHPSDRAWYGSAPFRARYQAALAEGFGHDAAGYVIDTLIAMRRWEVAFDRITCPVTILFGEHDLTHSPDHGATLQSRIPGASRRVLPGVGGALLWERADEVFAALAE